MKRSKTGINLPGILATLLLLVTTLYTPSISAHAEDNNEVVVTQKVNSAWDGGYVAEIIITNNTADELQNWKLTVNSELVITSIWNATAQQEGDAVIIVPMDYNANIVAGGSVNIGFCGAGEYSEMAITCTYDNGNDAENNNSENNTGDEENSGETNTGDVVPEENNNEENNSEETPAEETPSEEDVPEEVQLNAVLGFVYDEEGNAVAGAQVMIDDPAKQFVGIATVTDENGAYALIFPAGDYRLHFSCENYESEIISVSVIDGIENVVEDVVLKAIKPMVRIYAKDAELDKPIVGADVIIREGWDAHDTEVIAQYETDQDGYFETELPEGKYTIQLKASQYGFKYFNVVSEKNGEAQEVTMRSTAHYFDGTVYSAYENRNGTHSVIADVTVQFYSQTTGELAYETVTDKDGNYQVVLQYDTYYAVFQKDKYKTTTVNDIDADLVALVSATYKNDFDPVYMEFANPMGIVKGRVVDTSGVLVGYSKGDPGIYFNRMGVVGDEPVHAPDVNVIGILNSKYADGTYGDGTYYYLLPVGQYQVFLSNVVSGGNTAASQVIEVKENQVTVVPDIVLNRASVLSYPYNYKATVQVIDMVTGAPIEDARTNILCDGASASTKRSYMVNPTYSYTDANGEVKYQHNRPIFRLMVYADGYKERTINVIAGANNQIVYCGMVPETEPDPLW